MSVMRAKGLALAAVAVAGLGLAGCGSLQKAIGVTKVTPDEFRVVTKAPLVVPPEYALRPPAPGEPRPQELQPEGAARAALVGQAQAVARSDGEKLLIAKAGGDRADPLIRFVVDDETGDLAHKDKSFADQVMFWKKGDSATADQKLAQATASAANTPAPVDAAAEETRLKSLTGGKPVIIARVKTLSKLKLPGL